MKEGQEIWRADVKKEEKEKIKKILGKGYENIEFRTTDKNSTGGIETTDEALKKIISEAEAEKTEEKFIEENQFIKEADESQIGKIQKLKDNNDEEGIDNLIKNN